MIWWWWLACAAESGVETPETCRPICDELVARCALPSYPSDASCLEGCRYADAQGVVLEDFHACVMGADCTPFELVACEVGYGLD